MKNEDDNLPRPVAMTQVELAALYKVHPETFRRWLKPFLDQIGKPHNGSYIYTPLQVRMIFTLLGHP